MTAENRIIKDADKWCMLLNESDIGDVVMINGIMIMVIERSKNIITCEGCPFYNHIDNCLLVENSEYVTPCSPFNNKLGKSLAFTYEIPKSKLESLI